MRTLYHFPLDAGSRKLRIQLAEKSLEVALKVDKAWERRERFLDLDPGSELPVLIEADGTKIAGAAVAGEYLEDAYPTPNLLGADPIDRAETRRLVIWFGGRFHQEVTRNLVEEKLMKRYLRLGQPDTAAIRAGHANIRYHLDYIAWLTEQRHWLAGETLTLADIAAAAELSTVDYLGDVPWSDRPAAKDWYARMKSRPSLRPLLSDAIAGIPPVPHYADPDF